MVVSAADVGEDGQVASPGGTKPRRWPKVAVLAFGGLVCVGVVTSLLSFVAWRQWPWTQYPSRLHYCGRDYVRGSPASPGVVEAKAHDVGQVPGWFNFSEVWAVHSPQQTPGNSCGTIIWVRNISGDFRSYALSGGP